MSQLKKGVSNAADWPSIVTYDVSGATLRLFLCRVM